MILHTLLLHYNLYCFVSTEDDVCNEFSSLFLAHMATDYSSKMAIGTADGLEPLINLLASPDPDIQKNSLSAICLLVEVNIYYVD